MNVLITSGGTREYIDDVRVLTNISSGALGAIVAERFLRDGHNVTYLHSKSAILPNAKVGDQLTLVVADNVRTAFSNMKEIVPRVDIVIHSMAVSDFTFNRTGATKCKSDSTEDFIQFMADRIEKAPKILPHITKWNPNVILVGFKFEVGKTREELAKIAETQMKYSGCNFVLTNDKKIMQESNAHIAWLVDIYGNSVECYSKFHIANAIYEATVKS